MDKYELVKIAEKAVKNSYSPYSGFSVGAALLLKDGKVYKGCNIENATFGATVCAERTAFFKAISDGEREFDAIAVVGIKDGEILKSAMPCGICRQVMAEFCTEEFKIYIGTKDGIDEYTLGELLPYCFSL